MNALLQLIKSGQSYWLDNLTRRKIASGELNKRVVLQGLRGVTSNPAILDKAISGGDDYDAQLQQLVHAGCEIHEIYERLVIIGEVRRLGGQLFPESHRYTGGPADGASDPAGCDSR